MSVVEPFVLGLAITELTKISWIWQKAFAGAGLNTSHIAIIMTLYLFRGVLYELGSYYSNYFMTNAVQKTVQDMRNDLSHKINHIPVSFLTGISSEICSDVLLAMSKLSRMPCNSPSYKSLMLSLPCSLSSAWSCTLNMQLGLVVILSIPITLFQCSIYHEKSQPYFLKSRQMFWGNERLCARKFNRL